MKKLLFLLIATCVISRLYAVPASPHTFIVTQPDGTQLTLRTIGDEYYHWTETEDNHIVMQNDNGYYEYATIDNNEIRLSGVLASSSTTTSPSKINKSIPDRTEIINLMLNKRSAIIAQMDSLIQMEDQEDTGTAYSAASSSKPLTQGNQKVLCILIGFPDRPFTKTKAEFEAMWNATGYNVLGSQGSVREYYLENSYGHLNVTATVVGPYTAEHNSSYYDTGTSSSTIGNSNVKELIKEAISASKNDIRFKDFDVNGDKYVDAVHVIFAGYGKEYSRTAGVIWSHRSQLSRPVRQDAIYKAQEYFCTPELAKATGTAIAPIGTVCHEYGHTLGAPDYYDLNSAGFIGTGYWDVMDSGSWNNEGRCPAHHNPYTKAYIYNWAIPAIIPASAQNTIYDMSPSHNSALFYRINTSTANEFFLIENKTKVPNTFNAHIPSSGGLLIYHIHSDLQNAIANRCVNTSHPQKCYIVCASATSEPNSTPSSYGSINYASYPSFNNKTFFTSTSIPSAKSWAGAATGVDICFIRRNGNNIQFVVNPQIQGASTLSSQSVYSVTNIPNGAKIKWTYTFTPTSSYQHPLGKPIIFTNGDSTSSVTIKRGTFPVVRDTTGPLPPRDSMAIMMSKSNPILESISAVGPVEFVYYTGTAILKAAITSGGYSYVITKTIVLSSTSAFAGFAIADKDAENVSEKISDGEDGASSTETLKKFRLVYGNPVSTSTINIQIEQLYNDNYIPYQGDYKLYIWNNKLGLVQQISGKQPEITVDCGRLPKNIYQIILQVNGNVVASSKMLIL